MARRMLLPVACCCKPADCGRRTIACSFIFGVFVAYSFCNRYIEHDVLGYDKGEQNLMREIALSAQIDLLFVCLALMYHCVMKVLSLLSMGVHNYTVDVMHMRRNASARIICLASEKDCHTLRFRDLCRVNRAREELQSLHKDIQTIYISPTTLWTYVYCVSASIFVAGYSISAGQVLTFACFAAGMLCSAVVISVLDAVRHGTRQLVVMRTFLSILQLVALIFVIIGSVDYVTLLCDVSENRYSPQCIIKGGWLGILLPFFAPILLFLCRSNIRFSEVNSLEVIAFALPFLSAISLAFLCVYSPFQIYNNNNNWGAATIMNNHSQGVEDEGMLVREWWVNGNQTAFSSYFFLQSRRLEGVSFSSFCMWVITPLFKFLAYVLFVSCLLINYRLLSLSGILILLVSLRLYMLEKEDGNEKGSSNHDKTLASIVLASVSIFGTCILSKPQPVRIPLADHVNFVLQDVDDATSPLGGAVPAAAAGHETTVEDEKEAPLQKEKEEEEEEEEEGEETTPALKHANNT